ncbi:MAG: response regulator transcription factor [Oscillospiraceae bacterium]|nr:response regulator transcription factor [Oscillospiraceae bacterium]
MFKVLLVDDEPNVRQGIKMMIPWEEIDCSVIGEADDGDDGLSKIMSLRPDIVIADIKMPGKTGIEMTDAAMALGFKGKVIILSGYSDFTYAKTAIALGVENFILKPVDEDELIEAIKNAGQKIKSEKERFFRQEAGREYLNEQLVKGLFAGDEVQIAEVIGRYSYSSYCTAVIGCDSDQVMASETYKYVRKFFETVSNVDIVSIDITGVLGMLFKGWKYDDVKNTLRKLSESCENTFIAIGTEAVHPAQINCSYGEAAGIFKNRFIYSHLRIVAHEDIREINADDDYASKIYAFMEINDNEKLNNMLDSFLEAMQSADNTPDKARIACMTLVMDVRSKMIRSVADKKPENLIPDDFVAEISEMTSLYEIVSAIRERFAEVSDKCFGKTTKSTMERVVQYIRANYNHELKLEMLAGIFGYNSAYLGKVFHQYTGENFNNYLDEIRITEAKRLLADEEHKVYEVAEMVGYTNINYFHNKFKKYVGMSPLSYKKKHGFNE